VPPEKVLSAATFVVSAPAPSAMPPAPARVPTVSVWPARSKTAPGATVSSPVSDRMLEAPRRSVPPATVVPPA
jgi:hypothetical protein